MTTADGGLETGGFQPETFNSRHQAGALVGCETPAVSLRSPPAFWGGLIVEIIDRQHLAIHEQTGHVIKRAKSNGCRNIAGHRRDPMGIESQYDAALIPGHIHKIEVGRIVVALEHASENAAMIHRAIVDIDHFYLRADDP